MECLWIATLLAIGDYAVTTRCLRLLVFKAVQRSQPLIVSHMARVEIP
ncbi:hypothetical protein GGD40_006346 [Paraburkholderia bryophila]|uniref:Uncharacterized protein n=1 Tax=Paraburkholderia bryophila TaxID=420952 RepID=A0A7Y9WUV2_9BURK|nr:hypothetical protein [Paraburkholderia bryophila]